jgi:hypothetical protein
MKKLTFTLLYLISGTTLAMTTANLSKQTFTCNGVRIESTTVESNLTDYCNNVVVKDETQIVSGQNAMRLRGSDQIDEDDIKPKEVNLRTVNFTADTGVKMACYYKNSTLQKCKYAPSVAKATNKPQASK